MSIMFKTPITIFKTILNLFPHPVVLVSHRHQDWWIGHDVCSGTWCPHGNRSEPNSSRKKGKLPKSEGTFHPVSSGKCLMSVFLCGKQAPRRPKNAVEMDQNKSWLNLTWIVSWLQQKWVGFPLLVWKKCQLFGSELTNTHVELPP